MYEIQICPIKKLYNIAAQADLSEVAALVVSSYDIDLPKLSGCYKVSAHQFQDISNKNANGSFNMRTAEIIKKFVLELPNNLDTLFVCCDSGKSRSSAMAAAISRYFGVDEMKIWKNPLYHPNPLVYKILCQAFDMYIPDVELNSLLHINNQAFNEAVRKNDSNNE